MEGMEMTDLGVRAKIQVNNVKLGVGVATVVEGSWSLKWWWSLDKAEAGAVVVIVVR